MNLEIFPNADAVARAAASFLAAEARSAIAARGQFVLALSGGRTPWRMLDFLADEPVAWEAVHVLQVDERIAPDGHADRNLTHIEASRFGRLGRANIHPIPVTMAETDDALRQYESVLSRVAGLPPILDLVHLGLGADGHTASLLPGDALLDEAEWDLGITGLYKGRRRVTMTYPILNRARKLLWLVTGADKAAKLGRLKAGDAGIPAGRIRRERAVILADRAALEGGS